MKAERSLESTGICELMYSSTKGIILGQDKARTVLSSPEVVLDMQRGGLACIDGRTSLMHLVQKSYYETDREIHYRFF